MLPTSRMLPHVIDEVVHIVWGGGMPLCSTHWPPRQRICLPCKLNVHHNAGCRGYRFMVCHHEAGPEDKAPLGHMQWMWSTIIGRDGRDHHVPH
jgi:hypothetical protein